MPLTPTNMRVVDVARLLNSTSQGFVLAQARLYRQGGNILLLPLRKAREVNRIERLSHQKSPGRNG